jgi:4-amino-4-deoxy-L-arabinose transferase-like glycosyltransferase
MATGVLCFALSLSLYYGTVLRVQLQKTDLLDLGPYPDAVEYFAQANSILKEGAPTIQIGYDKLPSRYPPGYSLLMIPWLSCLPHHGIFAPFRTNQTIGLFLLINGFALYFAIGRPLAGGLATLLLATQPAFITFSRSSMSDLSGAAAAVFAFALVYIGLRQMRRWPVYAAAIVLGLSLCIRPQLLFFAPLLIAMAFFRPGDSWRRWLMHCCLVVVVFAVASLPYFLFNALEFGNPFKTGYDFWVPDWTQTTGLFSVHNVPAQLAMLWSEVTASWSEFRVANLFGTGTYIVPPFVALVLLGLTFVRIDRFTVSVFIGAASYFIATLTYAFVDGRFYLPLFFLFVSLAILPAEWAISNALKLRFSLSTVAVLAVLLLTCLGYPSQSGFKPQKHRFQTWDALQYANGNGMSRQYEAQEELARSFRDAPGIVLSDTDSPYLNVLLPKPFVAAPIDDKHNYCYSRRWHYGKAEAIRLVTDGLDHAIPVYALFVPSEQLDQDVQRLPQIQGYTWKRSDRSDTRAVIMILTKDTVASSLNSVPAHWGIMAL